MAQMANIPPLNKINKFKPEMCKLSFPLSGIELPHRPRTFPNFLGSTSPPGSSQTAPIGSAALEWFVLTGSGYNKPAEIKRIL